MKYDPEKHHRRSIRLKEYDYRLAGAYFVTIVAQDRECLFGDIVNGEMQSNDAGQMINQIWQELPNHYPGVDIDLFVVMPNHFHGIIVLLSPFPQNRADKDSFTPLSLADIVHRFKTLTTTRYIHGVKQLGWRPFNRRLWQRNYYEHVIRNEQALDGIRDYIDQNPLMWMEDAENPAFVT